MKAPLAELEDCGGAGVPPPPLCPFDNSIDPPKAAQNRTNKLVHTHPCLITTPFPVMRQVPPNDSSAPASPERNPNGSDSLADPPDRTTTTNGNGQLRKVTLRRSGDNKFGFCFVGGMDTNFDIFVSSIIPGGVADIDGNLKPGDKIVNVNHHSFESVGHLEATQILKNASSPTVFMVKHEPEEFEALKQSKVPSSLSSLPANESIYIRAEFSFRADSDQRIPGKGLSFQCGDILLIFNMGDDDWWQAVKVSPTSRDAISQTGFIPSKKRVEKTHLNKARRVNFDVETELSKERRDKSFKKKFLCGSKTKKTKTSTADISSQTPPPSCPSYRLVELEKFDYSRPVFLMGAEYAKIADDLAKDDPTKYVPCISCTSRGPKEGEVEGQTYHFKTKQWMLEMLREGHFVEVGVFRNELYGTTIQEVNSHGQRPGVHCLLNVNPASVERLISLGVHPIVIFVRLVSIENTSAIYRHCKRAEHIKIFDKVRKIEETSSKLFTAMVEGSSYMEIYERVKSTIDCFGESPQGWVVPPNPPKQSIIYK